jgi:ATP-dependent Clp protease ATP-binding subunit ClpA
MDNLTNSTLSEFVMTIAGQIMKEMGATVLSMNHIFLAFLKIGEIGYEGAKEVLGAEIDEEEYKSVKAIFNNFPLSDNAYPQLYDAVKRSPNAAMSESIALQTILYKAKQKSGETGKQSIWADSILTCLLNSPSEIIRSSFLHEKPLDNGFRVHDNETTPGVETAAERETVSAAAVDTPVSVPGISQIARKCAAIQQRLLESIMGQDYAIQVFAEGCFQAELAANADKKRVKPRATFLFAGPPGVGKTFLAECAAEALEQPFARFDMSEYNY